MAEVESRGLGINPTAPPSNRRSAAISMTSPVPKLETTTPLQSFKSGHLNLDTFSPVNQNGSFEFDRVLKSGKVNRRVKNKGAWKPTWKPTYLVLRPNLLSMYKNDDETGIRASVTLSDVTAVAPVKKANTANVFGVFSPSKNYHFQGASSKDTADWIERIRVEARVDVHEEIVLASPGGRNDAQENRNPYETTDLSGDEDGDRPSSPELSHWPVRGQKGQRSRASTAPRQPSTIQDYSGNEQITSYSDFSDAPAASGPRTKVAPLTKAGSTAAVPVYRPTTVRNASQMSGIDSNIDLERVIHQGWLLYLKAKGGVKQWKKLWVVLRPKNLSFYKNEQEYSAVKIVSMSSVINAAEIDPISRSKNYCLQIILEDKTYRFCAPTEDALAKWLGSLKSVLARRQEPTRQITDAAAGLRLS
jgi:PH domain